MRSPVLALAALVCLCAVAGCALETAPAAEPAALGSTRPTFELWRDAAGAYHFQLVAESGEALLDSQSYTTRTAALNGVLSVLDNGLLAARYVLRDGPDGQAYFDLRAGNHEVIGTSGLYPSAAAAEAGIAATQASVADYEQWLAERRGRRFDVFRGADGRFYFNLHAGNGEIVLRSQGYQTEASALNGTFSVADHGIDPARYDVRQAVNGQWYFNLIASNGQVIGTSELYVSRYNAQRGRDAVVALLPTVELL